MEPIIVGVDDSEEARDALRWALDYATKTGAPVVAVTALEPPRVVGRAVTLDDLSRLDGIRAATGEWLRDFVDSVRGADRSVDIQTRVLDGHPVDVLVGESKDAQLVVVGARGSGLFHRLLLGSVSNGVLHHAHCSVAIIRTDDRP